MGTEPNPIVGAIRTDFDATDGRTFEPGFIATLLIRTGASMMLGSAIAAAGFLWLTPAATDQGYAASVLAFEKLHESLLPLTLFFCLRCHEAGTGIGMERHCTVTWTAQELVDIGVILQTRGAIAERLAPFRKASDELKRGVKAARRNRARTLRSLEDSLNQAIQISESGQDLFRQ
jgi:hypothetical protein